ncbi:Protein EFR3 [Apiospora rasikravindrae]|uniref:Protein EFR3 n=1 Tax=Apiospora rasikravindrae TaxID=990691 RepID=A0ABR1RME5_9PEZI
MNALHDKCRPKHQVLVLKCYPRTTKGAVDVKPNSSELSYLLFYATSRRSKIQKVGAFLEKKTASDVWRLRIGNVQVTLQIFAALIEKAPKDLPLFAQNVMKVLGNVLRSNDITMVEASLPTFHTFCEHQDASSLFADQTYVQQYEEIVQAYAAFASTKETPGKSTLSKPVVMRWRNAGLEAIKSVAEAEALVTVAGRQLDVIVPMILENLRTDNEEFLDVLIHRAHVDEKADPQPAMRHRTSISTVQTNETSGEPNPIALSGSAADADKLAEEETGLAAMHCLKQICVVPNRAQLHSATMALLKFVRELVQADESVVRANPTTGRHSGWAIEIFGLVAKWAPVQDRYVILLATMDTLARTPSTEENIPELTVLVAIMSSLLRSDVNLIGLSVMDVLLGLLGQDARLPGGTPKTPDKEADPEQDQHMTPQRKEYLARIQQCIGDLATHVYYADQITDMISAILVRLKPHPSTVTGSPPTEKVDGTPATGSSAGSPAGSPPDDQHSPDAFVYLERAKITALKAIKSILLVANPKTKVSGNVNLTRNKVPVQVWEGTHWLLRDPDGLVRKSYADALTTWLDRETTRADLIARDEAQKATRMGNKESQSAAFARRAVSSASNREKPTKAPRSHFLQLLHLSIYDNALQFAAYETDMVLCHVLLVKLVTKLGVNAARYGVPMICRLQEDIQETEAPISKVHLGSLCHGYFWALSEMFDCETTDVGRAIQNEISRRRSKHFWIDGINVPAPPMDSLGTPGKVQPESKIPVEQIATEALLPFDDRLAMVECICTNYQDSPVSPPTSPGASPGRTFNIPIFNSTLSAIPPAETDRVLPTKFKEDMLAEWTKESAMMALQEGSKTASLNGSKAATTATRGNRLHVNGQGSPVDSYTNLRPASHTGAGGSVAALRKTSVQSRGSGVSSSSRGIVASVDQLKSVLSGEVARPGTLHTVRDDDSSDSMVSYDYSPSELSFNPAASEGGVNRADSRSRSKSRERKTSDPNGTVSTHPTPENGREESGYVPPVPPLPSGVTGNQVLHVTGHRPESAVSSKDHAVKAPRRRSVKSRGGESILTSALGDDGSGAMDLQSLLKGIDSKSREHTLGNLSKPPTRRTMGRTLRTLEILLEGIYPGFLGPTQISFVVIVYYDS